MEAIIITAILFAAFVGGIYLVTRERPSDTAGGGSEGIPSEGGGGNPVIRPDEHVK